MATTYRDIDGVSRSADPEVLLEVLRALGAPVATREDAPGAVRARRLAAWKRPLPPARLASADGTATVPVRILASDAGGRLDWTVRIEGGGVRRGRRRLSDLPLAAGGHVEGRDREVRRFRLDDPLPTGIHRLEVAVGGMRCSCHFIVAPERAYDADRRDAQWGVAHPLYALRHADDWGIGDFTGLRRALHWVCSEGGDVLATLPLLATFVDEPGGHPPYRPLTRLHWNEAFVDPTCAPELATSPAGRSALARLPELLGDARVRPLVNYERIALARHAVLAPLAENFFRGRAAGSAEFRRFLAERPTVGAYARFRAARTGADGQSPKPGSPIPAGSTDPALVRMHVYAQWLAERQMRDAAEAERGALLLDFPVGVHPEGFDVWREPHLYAAGMSVGAPPDPFFAGGQDWSVPPLRPDRIRENGYASLREALGFSMRAAGFLRIDHVMGLSRLFWVPAGRAATEGVYVAYPAEEIAAVIRLASHREACEVVGEDLGTVSPEVRALMDRSGLRRTYVLGFALPGEEGGAPGVVPDGAVAMLNTHDMAPWSAFAAGEDIDAEDRLGRLPSGSASGRRQARAREVARLAVFLEQRPDGEAVGSGGGRALLAPALAWLGRSAARLVLVSLDDLLGAREPQNRPGTDAGHPNWRRRATVPVEFLGPVEGVRTVLNALHRARRRRDGDG